MKEDTEVLATVGHFHRNPSGVLVRCYHECKNSIASGSFWAGVTLSFPIEHWLWEKVWPFTEITKLLGL